MLANNVVWKVYSFLRSKPVVMDVATKTLMSYHTMYDRLKINGQ